MPQDNKPTGLFGYGLLPSGTRSETIAERERFESDRAFATGAELSKGALPGHRMSQALLHRGGAQLGQALRRTQFGQEKLGLRELPPEAERSLAIRDAGTRRFQDRLTELGPEADAMDAGAKRRLLMNSMAQEAAAQGDMETYAQLLNAINQEAQADSLNRAKIADLEGKTGSATDVYRERLTDVWNQSSRDEKHQTFQAAKGQVAAVGGILDLTENLRERGMSPDLMNPPLGQALSILNTAKNVFTTARDEGGRYVRAITGTLFGSRDPNQRAYDGDMSWGELDARVERSVPDSIEGAPERARYKAAMIQLAYAAWRQNEGSGSRQASNQDIAMALDSLGAHGGDMNTVLQTLLANTVRGIDKFASDVDSTMIQAQANEIPADYAMRTLYGAPKAVDDLLAGYGALLERAQPFLSVERAPLETRQGQEETGGQSLDDLLSSWLD